jgi:MFS transporter, DHA1 family, multidrug resistance protein
MHEEKVMNSVTAFDSTPDDAHALTARTNQKPTGKRVRSIITYLTGSCALMMTGFGIAMPVFAKRLGELGSGVEALSLMAMAAALAQFLLAPFMGALADRFGRRRIVLLAVSGLAITNLAFLVARSTETYIVLRFLQGAFSVGMLPAAMGVVADLVPEQKRIRWVGVLMSGYAVGFSFGPVIGGFLFERWGFIVPFGGAFLLDLLALYVAWVRVPETREAAIRRVQQRDTEQELTSPAVAVTGQRELAASFPRPRSFFAALLLLDVIAAFGMAFIEPQMVFYLYNALSLTTAQYGLMMGGYGVATLVGQVALGQIGDHFGRKPIIALGFLLNATLSLGLILVHQFSLLAPLALLAGLGSAFITTGLGVCYLDITVPQHRSVAVGIRESAISFGAVAGPLLAAFIGHWLAPRDIFTVAALTMLAAAILALAVLKPQGQAKAHALADASVDAGGPVAATILTTRTMVEVAPAMRESASRLTAATDDVVSALRRVPSPLASQGGYNEEVGKAAVERMAA